MISLRYLVLVIVFAFGSSPAFSFDLSDILRDLDKEIEDAMIEAGRDIGKAAQDASRAIEKAAAGIKRIQDDSATRIFAGPNQFPPVEYAAYAILAFPTRPTDSDIDRYEMLCEAYVSAIPHASEVSAPKDQQLVTVWPVEEDSIANHINRIDRDSTCTFATLHYGFLTSRAAIDDAERSGLNFSGRRGPFLLAWAPPTDRGLPNAPLLFMDLSTTETLPEAKRRMTRWVDDIEEDPEIWKDGWAIEKVKFVVKNWANDIGDKVLVLFLG